MEIEEHKAGDTAEQNHAKQNNRHIAHHQGKNKNGCRGNPRYTGRQAVEAINQVNRIGNANDPEYRNRNTEPANRQVGRSERDVNQVDFEAKRNDDASGNQLAEHFPFG